MVEKMDKTAHETIGKQMLTDAIEMEMTFLRGTRKEEHIDEALAKIEELARDILIDLKTVEDMGVWRPRQCWKIGSRASNIMMQAPAERARKNVRR